MKRARWSWRSQSSVEGRGGTPGYVVGPEGPLPVSRNRRPSVRVNLLGGNELVGGSGCRHEATLAHHEDLREHHD